MSASAERQRAVRLLIRVEEGAFASRLLASSAEPGARVRVFGVLRWQRLLDAALAAHLQRGLHRLDPEVRAVLRLGLFEAARLGVPAAVATDAAVHLVRRLGKGSAAGLVNAVLRRAAAGFAEVERTASADVLSSHPRWLYERWCEHFGAEAAEAAMAAAQEPAPPWVWFRDPERPGPSAEPAMSVLAHPWCPGAFTSDDEISELMAAVAAGEAYAQDPSSQLVAHLAARIVTAGSRVADLCAAPGGKSALLQRLVQPGFAVAADLNPRRTRVMQKLLGGTTAHLLTADAGQPPLTLAAWDLVLLDAPCTGTGTLRRHPELRWRLELGSINDMAEVQRRLLDGATPLVAPGGVLLYATCSIEPEENEAHFSEPPKGFDTVDLGALLPEGVPWATTAAGGIRILPHAHGDGFTMHALRRVLR